MNVWKMAERTMQAWRERNYNAKLTWNSQKKMEKVTVTIYLLLITDTGKRQKTDLKQDKFEMNNKRITW